MKELATEEEARNWVVDHLYNTLGYECVDNVRFAFMDDPKAMQEYHHLRNNGCCGEFDQEIDVAGRKAIVGCNYGH